MENPCKKCLVRVNCTEVCPEKLNYKKLLEIGVENHRKVLHQSESFRKHYIKFLKLQKDNLGEISKIKLRKANIEL